ncbi:MAG: TIGR04282 family arsenosugar biosynthesis glycosyltransferase [Sphingomonadales bacterium]
MSSDRHLVIFVKAPRLGTVKTRLARGIGAVAACGFYRRTVSTLIRRLAPDPRWRTYLAVTPDRHAGSRNGFEVWPNGIARLPQGGGDLGERMARRLRALPTGPGLIIGTDIPDISRGHIWRAFRALDSHDAAFGPCVDGGYWLVGLGRRAMPRELFQGVRWSGPHALADSVATLGPRARIAMLETLHDIDTAEDLAAWQAEQGW